MKNKIGKCLDCGAERLLIAGRCSTHYWQHRQEINAKKPKAVAKRKEGKVMGAYLASQTLTMPAKCEECGKALPKTSWMKIATVAHILPKRKEHGYPSVALHPINKMYLCIDCHTNFDNLGKDFIVKMQLLPKIKERVQQLLPLLTEKERNRVPEYLLPTPTGNE